MNGFASGYSDDERINADLERDPQQSRFWILILFFRADWIGGVQKKVEDVGTRFSNMMADLGYAGHVLLDEVGRRGLFSDCMIS